MTPSIPTSALSRRVLAVLVLCGLTLSSTPPVAADDAGQRLLLLADVEKRTTHVEIDVKKPFEVFLIAERDAEDAEISTVVFQLEVPDGLVVVGEELLVESLIALGTTRSGMNLAFHCVGAPQVQVLRLRMVAMKPLDKAVIGLNPEKRTNFLGIVACKNDNYEKWEVDRATLTVTAR